MITLTGDDIASRRALRDDIIRGVHAPGTRLAEEALSARYGVSRVPVREALRALGGS